MQWFFVLGKDAFHSAQAIVTALKAGLEEAGLNPDLLQLIQDTSPGF